MLLSLLMYLLINNTFHRFHCCVSFFFKFVHHFFRYDNKMTSDSINPLCIIIVKGGAEGGKLIFKVSLFCYWFIPNKILLILEHWRPLGIEIVKKLAANLKQDSSNNSLHLKHVKIQISTIGKEWFLVYLILL